MPIFERDDVRINYVEEGSGFPVLLIAPGGMRSTIDFWYQTPWNPIEQLSGDYRVIAMDQRNAGGSTGPVSADDGWHTYIGDQLALMDHLGADRFHVAGMCIGGSYILGLIEAAPERVASGVLFQTIGLDNNRGAFYDMFDSWATDIASDHPNMTKDDWNTFRGSMYDPEFLFTVDRDFVAQTETPMLVLLGNDLYHPESTSREIVKLAPNATMVENWKEPEHHDSAKAAVADFLAANTP